MMWINCQQLLYEKMDGCIKVGSKEEFGWFFFTVTNPNNSPLVKAQLVHLDQRLHDKFVLPSLSSFNLTQSFHEMTKEQRETVVTSFAGGVNVDKFEPNFHHTLQDH